MSLGLAALLRAKGYTTISIICKMLAIARAISLGLIETKTARKQAYNVHLHIKMV